MNWNKKIVLQNTFLLVLLLLGSFVATTAGKSNDCHSVTISKYVEQEKELAWDIRYSLGATSIDSGETININYTVLSISTSNVNFTFHHDDRVFWHPVPTDYVLAPGESYTQSFHLNSSALGGTGFFRYFARIITENQTATVRWGYEVINTNFLPTIDIITTFAIITVISVISILIFKRKR